MASISRRNFVQLSLGAAAAAHLMPLRLPASPNTFKGSDVGIYVSLNVKNVDKTFEHIKSLGFSSCELYASNYSMEMAGPLKAVIEKYQIEVLSLFTLGPGPTTWDFYEGQKNIGLVNKEYRETRLDALMLLSDLSRACGIKMVETHVGYMPENPNDPNYADTIEALKKIVGYCHKNEQTFLYHAGQESPTTLLRTILDVGYANQGIGMDTANLIMYDRGHPYHALDVYGKYVKLVNAKDGLYPTDARNLGKEVQIGRGKVDFPVFLRKLKSISYKGPIIIEREASEGKEWDSDVRQSKIFLQDILNSN